MQHTPTQESQSVEMSLRDHLLASQGPGSAGHQNPYPPPPNTQSGPEHPYQTSETSSHEHLDPNVANQQMQYTMSGDSAGDDGLSPDARKGKRELSTSKRAAQNRAAQRAFRQRKEGYIKKLEEQVKEFQTMEQQFRTLQNENYQLREYILNLQSRLLESSSDVPPAPPHISFPPSSVQPGGGNHHREAESAAASGGNHDSQFRRELQHHASSTAPPPPPQHRQQSPPSAAAAPTAEMSHDPALTGTHASQPPHQQDGTSAGRYPPLQAQDPPRRSPYGLGSDYPTSRPPESGAVDSKTS